RRRDPAHVRARGAGRACVRRCRERQARGALRHRDLGVLRRRVHAHARADARGARGPRVRAEDPRGQPGRPPQDRHAGRRGSPARGHHRESVAAGPSRPAMTAPAAAARPSGLVKRFGDTTALQGVSFSVAAGEIFGFIGPDGAGKSTLFRILATLIIPSAGTAEVLGRNVVTQHWDVRARVGYMPGRFSLYTDLSVEENLTFFASVFGTTIQREYEQIKPIYVQLEPFKDRHAAALSGGMKQKLALCCALVHPPDILFLDEPTTGLAPV